MKVIHFSHSDINGGAARAAYRIHHSLLRLGVKSRMWVNNKSSDDWTVNKPIRNIEKILSILRPQLINVILKKIFKTKNKIIHSPSIFSSDWIERINNSNFDVVHLHWIQNEMLSIRDISRIKKPIVWTLHDMWGFCGAEHYTNDSRWIEGYKKNNRPLYESGFDINLWTWQRKKKYWKKPIQIITPSRWLSKCVAESDLMHSWPVSTIANPIEIKIFKQSDKMIARKNLNLPIKKPLLLFGALGGAKDYRKGFDLLSKALKHLKNFPKLKNLEIIIFGQSKPRLQPHLNFPTHYIGHKSDDISLSMIYNAVDACVIPSRLEAFGQIGSEAQSCGIPVIAFDSSGLKDIILHKKTGYLAKAYEAKDLAYGINLFMQKRKSIEVNNLIRKNAVLKYSEKKIAISYFNIYKKLLK